MFVAVIFFCLIFGGRGDLGGWSGFSARSASFWLRLRRRDETRMNTTADRLHARIGRSTSLLYALRARPTKARVVDADVVIVCTHRGRERERAIFSAERARLAENWSDKAPTHTVTHTTTQAQRHRLQQLCFQADARRPTFVCRTAFSMTKASEDSPECQCVVQAFWHQG